MDTQRVAVAAGIVIALVASAGLPAVRSGNVQFEAEGTLSGWEAVLNYEIDANWTNVTDYWIDGDFSNVITCDVDWVLVTDESTSTDRDNLKQYALDYDEGEFGFLQVKDGTQTKKVAVCSSFDLTSANGSEADWNTFSEPAHGGPNGEDSATVGPREVVGNHGTDKSSITDEEAGDRLKLFTADATGSWTPYTGEARARLRSDSSGTIHWITMMSVGGVKVPTGLGTDEGTSSDAPCGRDCNLKAGQDDFLVFGTPGVGHIKARAWT